MSVQLASSQLAPLEKDRFAIDVACGFPVPWGMILPILTDFNVPGTVLRQKACPIEVFDEHALRLVQDLTDTLYDSRGIGLAANQIGALKRAVVIDLSAGRTGRHGLHVFINPVLRKGRGQQHLSEGCLSMPGAKASPTRYARVEIDAQDALGRPFRLRADGLMAVCIQHEMDHLDGIIMTAREQMAWVA